jgi:SAM-dependent methyltransferase
MEFIKRLWRRQTGVDASAERDRTAPLRLPVPREFRRGRLKHDERASVEAALGMLDYILESTGFPDYASLDVLDFGCGVRLTQALLQDGRPIGHYFGVDVHPGMIGYLRNNADDPRFEFAVVPFQNDMYNPDGEPMRPDSPLPCGDRTFDLIIALSVFTHLTPHDFQHLLQLLRRHVKPDGRLFLTCFIDETIVGKFHDAVPDKPLWRALYREAFVREMVAAARWEVIRRGPRRADKQIVDHLVCRPVREQRNAC